MSDNAGGKELIRRLSEYISRVINDPGVIQKDPRAFQAAVNSWKLIRMMLPGVDTAGQDEFEKTLNDIARMNPTQRKALASRWRQGNSAPRTQDEQMLELQKLINRRSQLFGTLNSIVNKFDESSDRVIQKLGQG